MTKYNAIILPDKIFISDVENKSWHARDLSINLLFDGERAKKTNKDGWFELSALPKRVEKLIKPAPETEKFKLKDGFSPSEKLPIEVTPDYFEWLEDEEEYKNNELKSLYEPIYSERPEYLEPVEFEISTIAHKNSGWAFVKAPPNVQHYLLDEITKAPDLLQDEKCFLTTVESYKRIREFVLKNINLHVATVSSNYDFHFEVCKKITLHEKEKYQKNIKPFSKRPKYVTDYKVDRKISVYDIIPNEGERKSYSKNSCVAPKFEGESYSDLESKISEYLEELIAKINEPLKDCPHCKGVGVIINN